MIFAKNQHYVTLWPVVGYDYFFETANYFLGRQTGIVCLPGLYASNHTETNRNGTWRI